MDRRRAGLGGALWLWRGQATAGQYFAGYLLEKALSVDNVFVFVMLFASLGVPEALQRRVLHFGVAGALVPRRVLPVSGDYAGPRFFLRTNGRIVVTPPLVALVAIEVTDLVFALHSIPAVFGVTRDLLVVFTSNAFAVPGLRAVWVSLAVIACVAGGAVAASVWHDRSRPAAAPREAAWRRAGSV